MTDLRLDHIEVSDAVTYLKTLPDACVNLCVTSPPYLGLRSYLPDSHAGKAQEVGTEDTPAAYIARLIDVFREVRRVLRDDGSVYCNLGDSYGDKQLLGIPWRFVFAMQDDGWLLREDIVWQKPNPMPESVKDRCTRAHEYIFHFTKQPRYWYDAQAVAEPSTGVSGAGFSEKVARAQPAHGAIRLERPVDTGLRNRRSVWSISPAQFRESHFATFPEAIPEIIIKAACPEWCCAKCGAPYEAQVERESNWEARRANGAAIRGDEVTGHNGTHGRGMSHDLGTGAVQHHGYAPSCACNAGKRAGVVLDPFSGAGTVALVAKRLNRRYIGCDLNAEYVRMAEARIDSIPYTLFSLMEVAK